VNRTRLLQLAGYNAFFWLWFWLFCYWTFPYERLAAFLTDRVAESGSGYSLEIGELSPYWVTGVALSNVKVRRQGAADAASADASDKAKKKKDDAIRIREARARMGILSLLLGGKSLSFSAVLEQGEIEGEYEEDGDTKRIDARLTKIDLQKLGILDSLVSLPVKGTLEGAVDLTLAKAASKSSGKVTLTMKGLTFGDGEAKLKLGSMGGLTIDPVNAGNVTLELDVKEGVGQVKRLVADGKDVELKGSGEVRFSDPLSRSRLDVLLQIKFTDAYRNKSSRTKALFSLLDGASIPQVRAAKTPDGTLAFKLVGALSSVRAVPSARSVSTRTAGKRAAPAAEAAADDDDED
jgi:type II secretion system protein N